MLPGGGAFPTAAASPSLAAVTCSRMHTKVGAVLAPGDQ